MTKGTIDLVAIELNNEEPNNRKNRLSALQKKFGFEIELLKLATFSEKQQAQLLTGSLLTNVKTTSVYKLLNDNLNVLAFEKIETAASHITSEAQQRVMGTINMITLQLEPIPEQLWHSKISTLSKLF